MQRAVFTRKWAKAVSCAVCALLTAVFTMAASPYVPMYGGTILVINESAYNLYMVFGPEVESADDTAMDERRLCVDRGEEVSLRYWTFEETAANPGNVYESVSFYDYRTGALLKTVTRGGGEPWFVHTSGDWGDEKRDAVFTLRIGEGALP